MHFVSDSVLNIWCTKAGRLIPNRLADFTLGALSHLDTQIRQRRRARDLINAQSFDLVHEPIPVSPKQPSMMFGLSVPVVIGPLNGGMDYPKNFNSAGVIERSVIGVLRATSALANFLIPGKLRAALILVANKRTFDALPAPINKNRVLELVENGVDTDRFYPALSKPPNGPLRIIYVGRLVDWKRVDLLVAACAKMAAKIDYMVDVVGDGPERGALEREVNRLSLSANFRFRGWIPHSKAAELLRNADVMVLPSMRECGGAVVLEAMASAIPVIATNWGGPADYVGPSTGILITPGTPDRFVDDLSEAVLWMARNPETRLNMGRAGRDRAERFYDWRVKAERVLELYEAVINDSVSTVTERVA